MSRVPSRSHAVHKLTTWITGRDISKVTSSLTTMRREATGLATEALITTSGPGEARERGRKTHAIDSRAKREKEREPTTTAAGERERTERKRERDNARTRGEREEAGSEEARRAKMLNK